MANMSQFDYLIDKIDRVDFSTYPFKHLYLENFLSKEHFDIIQSCDEINIPIQKNVRELVETLIKYDYHPVEFPGCVTDIESYIRYCEGDNVRPPEHTRELTEGFGMSMRLAKYSSHIVKELIDFLNSKFFLDTIKNKFNRKGEIRVETAIQKYLSGYEIAPHPDIRKKCLTYMLNINTSDHSEKLNIHTHYMKFKSNKEYIKTYWKENSNVDRCWVPWEWAETSSIQNKNNSIVFFAPDNDTLHGVKLDYDHLLFQRTQIYGNLWYTKHSKLTPAIWKNLP